LDGIGAGRCLSEWFMGCGGLDRCMEDVIDEVTRESREAGSFRQRSLVIGEFNE